MSMNAPQKRRKKSIARVIRPSLHEKTIVRLWVLAGGRCQYAGCNAPLWRDDLTLADMNGAYIAHIRDVNPKTHRYDSTLSPQLATDISNLMLMCDKHHRLIDNEQEAAHGAPRLLEMKRRHEARIEVLTSIREEMQTHALLYAPNVGAHNAVITWEKAALALQPDRYPLKPAIELGMKNSSLQDHEPEFWKVEREHLRRQFAMSVRSRLATGSANHFSVFAIAPQPLLIELGRLLSDIPHADVFQLLREPAGWSWAAGAQPLDLKVLEPSEVHPTVALNISLSATVTNDRLTSVVGDDASVWTLTVSKPHNDIIRCPEHLRQFRQALRSLLDRIKAKHGQKALLHVFPVVPVSVAVEIGRVWMPKADLPMRLYDQNSLRNGFVEAFEIHAEALQEVHHA